jgi:hypothetical protein
MKTGFFFLPITVLILFASCSARITGTLRTGGSADVSLRASLEPRMAGLIRSLAAAAGPRDVSAGEAVIDGPAIGRSMAAAPGIAAVALRNVSPAAVEGTIGISRVDEFLTPPENRDRFRFIRYEQGAAGGRLVISLDRSTAPQLMALLSAEVADYLSALMAPAATGEALSKTEYLGLVGSVYGKGVADEIAAARIYADITLPGTVNAARGGAFQGSLARFDIPLVDLLVLESPLYYEVSWK